jgi:hypothetical protein
MRGGVLRNFRIPSNICSVWLTNPPVCELSKAGSRTFCLIYKLFAPFTSWRQVREPAIFAVLNTYFQWNACLKELWVLPKSSYRSQAHFEYLTGEEKKSAHKNILNEHFLCACRTFYPSLILHHHLCILNSLTKLFFLWSYTSIGADCYDISVEQST